MAIFSGGILYWSINLTAPAEAFHAESNRTLGPVELVAAQFHPRFQYIVPPNPAEEEEEIESVASDYSGERPLMLEVTRGHPSGREVSYEEVVLAYAQHKYIKTLGRRGPLGKHKPEEVRLAHYARLPQEFAFQKGEFMTFFSEISLKPAKPHEVDNVLIWAEKTTLIRFPDSWGKEEYRSFYRMLEHHSELLMQRLGVPSLSEIRPRNRDPRRYFNPRKAKLVLQSMPLAAVITLPEATNPHRLYLQELLVRQTKALHEAELKGEDTVELPQLSYLEFCKEFERKQELERLSQMEHPEMKDDHEILTVEQIADVLSSVARDLLRQPTEKTQSSVESLTDLFETVASRLSDNTPILGDMEDVASMA